MTRDDIDALSSLSRITLSEDEKNELFSGLEKVLKYVGEINEAPISETKGEEALINVFREDENPHAKGAFTESILSVAPKKEGNYIKVKKILS